MTEIGIPVYFSVMALTPADIDHLTSQGRDWLHIRVFQSRCVTIDRWWNAADVYSSYWRMYVNNRDGAAVLIDGKRYRLTAHAVHLLPAWVRFTCTNNKPIEHLYAHFDVVGLPPELLRRTFDQPITLPPDPQIDALRKPLRNPATDAATWCGVKAMVYRALQQVMTRLPAPPVRDARLMDVIDLIEQRLADALTVADLADHCHLSTDHFARVFAQAMGQTPLQYITERRLAAAAQRLAFTDQSIDSIAEACGFTNRYYFSRVFARHMGLPPATFRTHESRRGQ